MKSGENTENFPSATFSSVFFVESNNEDAVSPTNFAESIIAPPIAFSVESIAPVIKSVALSRNHSLPSTGTIGSAIFGKCYVSK